MHSFIYFYIMAALRVSICLGLATSIWFIFNVNHGYYIPMTVMIIYAPFKFDLISARMKSRLLGVFLGVLYGVLLLQILKINENVILIIPLLAVFCLYFQPRNYTYAATIITMNVVMIFGLTDQQGQSAFSYGIARINDTFIASVICLSCELIFITQAYMRGGVYYRIGQIVKFQRYKLNFLLNKLGQSRLCDQKNKLSIIEVESVKQSILRNSQKLKKMDIDLIASSVESVNVIAKQIKVIEYMIQIDHDFVQIFKDKNNEIFDYIYKLLTDIDDYIELNEEFKSSWADIKNDQDHSSQSILVNAVEKIFAQLNVIYRVKCELIHAESN